MKNIKIVLKADDSGFEPPTSKSSLLNDLDIFALNVNSSLPISR